MVFTDGYFSLKSETVKIISINNLIGTLDNSFLFPLELWA